MIDVLSWHRPSGGLYECNCGWKFRKDSQTFGDCITRILAHEEAHTNQIDLTGNFAAETRPEP